MHGRNGSVVTACKGLTIHLFPAYHFVIFCHAFTYICTFGYLLKQTATWRLIRRNKGCSRKRRRDDLTFQLNREASKVLLGLFVLPVCCGPPRKCHCCSLSLASYTHANLWLIVTFAYNSKFEHVLVCIHPLSYLLYV